MSRPKTTPTEIAPRNQRIWDMRQHGTSYKKIGDVLGLSAGRVRQILERCKRNVNAGHPPIVPHDRWWELEP